MNQNELENNTENTQAEQNTALTDLEPNSEVKGGDNVWRGAVTLNTNTNTNTNANTYGGVTEIKEGVLNNR